MPGGCRKNFLVRRQVRAGDVQEYGAVCTGSKRALCQQAAGLSVLRFCGEARRVRASRGTVLRAHHGGVRSRPVHGDWETPELFQAVACIRQRPLVRGCGLLLP